MVLRFLFKAAGDRKRTVYHCFSKTFHLQKDSFVSNRKTIWNMQCILNYRCPNPAEMNEPISVTSGYIRSEWILSPQERSWTQIDCFWRLQKGGQILCPLASICHFLVNTDWPFCPPVLCPKCHMPALGWVWDSLLHAPSWCLAVPHGWIEQWPHHFWIWKPSLKQEYASHNPGHIEELLWREEEDHWLLPCEERYYPSHSSFPFFDTKI